jgi:hypothetical protein
VSEQINVGDLIQQKPDALSVQVTVHGNQVVTHYNQPREFVAFMATEAQVIGTRMLGMSIEADPSSAQQLINLAMGLIDHAYERRGDLKPAGGAVKHELIERHRKKLTQRLSLILNGHRENRTVSNQKLAKELVDAMLREVFT